MFSEDIDFFNSYARIGHSIEIEKRKNVNNLIEETKLLIKSLKDEKEKNNISFSKEIQNNINTLNYLIKLIN